MFRFKRSIGFVVLLCFLGNTLSGVKCAGLGDSAPTQAFDARAPPPTQPALSQAPASRRGPAAEISGAGQNRYTMPEHGHNGNGMNDQDSNLTAPTVLPPFKHDQRVHASLYPQETGTEFSTQTPYPENDTLLAVGPATNSLFNGATMQAPSQTPFSQSYNESSQTSPPLLPPSFSASQSSSSTTTSSTTTGPNPTVQNLGANSLPQQPSGSPTTTANVNKTNNAPTQAVNGGVTSSSQSTAPTTTSSTTTVPNPTVQNPGANSSPQQPSGSPTTTANVNKTSNAPTQAVNGGVTSSSQSSTPSTPANLAASLPANKSSQNGSPSQTTKEKEVENEDWSPEKKRFEKFLHQYYVYLKKSQHFDDLVKQFEKEKAKTWFRFAALVTGHFSKTTFFRLLRKRNVDNLHCLYDLIKYSKDKGNSVFRKVEAGIIMNQWFRHVDQASKFKRACKPGIALWSFYKGDTKVGGFLRKLRYFFKNNAENKTLKELQKIHNQIDVFPFLISFVYKINWDNFMEALKNEKSIFTAPVNSGSNDDKKTTNDKKDQNDQNRISDSAKINLLTFTRNIQIVIEKGIEHVPAEPVDLKNQSENANTTATNSDEKSEQTKQAQPAAQITQTPVAASSQPKGQNTNPQGAPTTQTGNSTSSGQNIQVQPSGQRVQVQPSGQRVQVQPSGQRVQVQPSGQRVQVQPSGQRVQV